MDNLLAELLVLVGTTSAGTITGLVTGDKEEKAVWRKNNRLFLTHEKRE